MGETTELLVIRGPHNRLLARLARRERQNPTHSRLLPWVVPMRAMAVQPIGAVVGGVEMRGK